MSQSFIIFDHIRGVVILFDFNFCEIYMKSKQSQDYIRYVIIFLF